MNCQTFSFLASNETDDSYLSSPLPTEVMAFVVDNLAAVKDIYFFRNSLWWKKESNFESDAINSSFAKLSWKFPLSEPQKMELQQRSSHKGHLSVFYQVKSSEPMLEQLCKFWNDGLSLTNSEIETLGLENRELEMLCDFVAKIDTNTCLFSFSHDMDFLYIFGPAKYVETFERNVKQIP